MNVEKILANSKILLVEDDDTIRESFKPILATYCKEVITAENGKRGITLFHEEKPDLVITDLRLPEMDGFDMIKAIQESHPHTPFVVVSAFSNPDDFIQAIRLKVHHYLISRST